MTNFNYEAQQQRRRLGASPLLSAALVVLLLQLAAVGLVSVCTAAVSTFTAFDLAKFALAVVLCSIGCVVEMNSRNENTNTKGRANYDDDSQQHCRREPHARADSRETTARAHGGLSLAQLIDAGFTRTDAAAWIDQTNARYAHHARHALTSRLVAMQKSRTWSGREIIDRAGAFFFSSL